MTAPYARLDTLRRLGLGLMTAALFGRALLAPVVGADEGTLAELDFFERRVRPVLVERCLECHGDATQESGLRMDSREAVLRGGERGPAIVVGDVARSLLIEAVRRQGDLKMPPDAALSSAELSALERWVQRGAVWPAGQPPLASSSDEAQRAARLRERKEQHWAFQPIRKPDVPRTEEAWSRNPIDHFVLRKMREHGLSPAPQADRPTLVRRLSYGLTGLPPDADLSAVFGSNASDGAYESLVERLLEQPTFGEHWARHWLDVARYADTTGYLEGGVRSYPFAWTYRDYVVWSMNEDTPFDQFIREQLAADQLELPADQEWRKSAMGFLTLGPRFNYVRHEIIDDRIDVVTRGMLGLTVTCARCHDHKYDPVLADDYYGLYGIFASSDEPLYADLPRLDLSQGDFGRYRKFREQVARAARRFEQFHDRVLGEVQHDMRSQVGDYLRYLVQQMPEHRTVEQPKFETERGRIRGPTPYGPGGLVRWEHYITARGEDDAVFGLWNRLARLSRDEIGGQIEPSMQALDGMNGRLRAALLAAAPQSMLDVATVYGQVLEETYARWNELRDADPEATALSDSADEQLRQVLYADDSPVAMNAETAHDCYSDGEFGNYMRLHRELNALFVEYQDVAEPRAMVMVDRPELVQPRIFQRGNATRPGEPVERRFLRAFTEVDASASYDGQSGRLALAHAIASPNNPLTARVIVNRVWQWHFGRGLVDTPSDFGTRAELPSHPELLDWLAADFVEHGWSLKRLHRLIVTSATYRQSSVASKQAEETDPDNRWLSHMARRRLGFEELRDSLLAVSGRLSRKVGGRPVKELDVPRRSLYLEVNRDDPSRVLATFDFPSPDISAEKRAETTVPQQALFLMNSPFVATCAERLLARMPESLANGPVESRIDWLYRQVLRREPQDRERELARALVTATDSESEVNAEGAEPTAGVWRDLAQVLIMSNEFLFVD